VFPEWRGGRMALHDRYLKLTFWAGALALLIWPYDIGAYLAALHH